MHYTHQTHHSSPLIERYIIGSKLKSFIHIRIYRLRY